jgi:hypothetical protein
MEPLIPASVVVIVGLVIHIACLATSCVMLVRDEAEGKRVLRQLEALLDRSADETTPPARPGASC